MKKIKTVLMTLFVCALGYGGYTAYDYITMSDAERFLLQNIEALAIEEPGSGGYNDSCTMDIRYRKNAYTVVCNSASPMTCSEVKDKEPTGQAKYHRCTRN